MKLVIVESPTKAKTISRFLESDYQVLSSYGHIRDLPKGRLGVDLKNNFQPDYVIPEKAKKNVDILKKSSKKAEVIILATDEDREGEAIAFHLKHILNENSKNSKFQRITFHEITPDAIKEALKNPRGIDVNLFNAQQARRILDRLVGYELSPFLWKKVRKGLSAGRVQSVAVRLVVEREREREDFKSEEFWKVKVSWEKQRGKSEEKNLVKIINYKEKQSEEKSNGYSAVLTKINNKKLGKKSLANKGEVSKILDQIASSKMAVCGIERKKSFRTPPPPFRTSTLQQEAGRKLGFSAKRTMVIAQKLYEGKKIKNKRLGLITYMRTDSLNISLRALDTIKNTTKTQFGEKYILPSPRFYTKKIKGAQEAHEAIRPSYPEKTPDELAKFLERDEYKLYKLIWERTIACQMAPAQLDIVNINFKVSDYEFTSQGIQVAFDGFFKVLGKGMIKEQTLPALTEKEVVLKEEIIGEQNFTQPPARYTEATLIKALEENGVGRPSTYAPTISVIQERGYVKKDEKNYLAPEEIGLIVNDLLVKHFPDIVEIKFTARVEKDLDDIAKGDNNWVPMIKEFYSPFKKNLIEKDKKVEKFQKITNKKCPQCGKPLLEKFGRFGKFYACSGFPNCKYTEASEEDKKLEEKVNGEKCPKCGAPLKLKRSKWGMFMGCSRYPECKFIKKFENKTGVKCPQCGKGDLVERRGKRGPFYACNQYPKCKYIAKGETLKKIKELKSTKN